METWTWSHVCSILQWRIQDFPTPSRRQPTIWSIFPKNCMKMKKFWPGWRIPCTPSLDPPLTFGCVYFERLSFIQVRNTRRSCRPSGTSRTLASVRSPSATWRAAVPRSTSSTDIPSFSAPSLTTTEAVSCMTFCKIDSKEFPNVWNFTIEMYSRLTQDRIRY